MKRKAVIFYHDKRLGINFDNIKLILFTLMYKKTILDYLKLMEQKWNCLSMLGILGFTYIANYSVKRISNVYFYFKDFPREEKRTQAGTENNYYLWFVWYYLETKK